MNRRERQLHDEMALRRASLEDARRELLAGELSQVEFVALEAREEAALERIEVELASLATATETVSKPRVRRTRLLVVGLVCCALAIGVLLWSALSPRQAGNSITGSLSLSNAQKIQQDLTEAEADVANGNVVTALDAYQNVLKLDPRNVQALTQVGWLDFSAGSSDQDLTIMKVGVSDLRQAISLAPRNPAPRLYYAIVADSTPGNQAVAKTQFEEFLALKPSKGQLAIARPFLKKLGLLKS